MHLIRCSFQFRFDWNAFQVKRIKTDWTTIDWNILSVRTGSPLLNLAAQFRAFAGRPNSLKCILSDAVFNFGSIGMHFRWNGSKLTELQSIETSCPSEQGPPCWNLAAQEFRAFAGRPNSLKCILSDAVFNFGSIGMHFRWNGSKLTELQSIETSVRQNRVPPVGISPHNFELLLVVQTLWNASYQMQYNRLKHLCVKSVRTGLECISGETDQNWLNYNRLKHLVRQNRVPPVNLSAQFQAFAGRPNFSEMHLIRCSFQFRFDWNAFQVKRIKTDWTTIDWNILSVRTGSPLLESRAQFRAFAGRPNSLKCILSDAVFNFGSIGMHFRWNGSKLTELQSIETSCPSEQGPPC